LQAQTVEEDISKAINTSPDFFVRFDSKNSIISNAGIKLWGMNIGLNHSDTFKYGLGIYDLSTPYHRNYFTTQNGVTDTIHTRLKFTYASVFAEYVFYQTKHWQGSMPIQLGIGGSNFTGNLNDSTYTFNQHPIFHYEATLTGHYRFLRYFAVGGGIGYRIMRVNNKAIDLQLTNPIYILKLKFFLGDAYRDVKSLFTD